MDEICRLKGGMPLPVSKYAKAEQNELLMLATVRASHKGWWPHSSLPVEPTEVTLARKPGVHRARYWLIPTIA